MASLMENLIGILSAETQEYENLLRLSEEKTPAIVAGSLEDLARLTDEEQAVVDRIGNLEKQREISFKDIANVINKDVKTLKLTDLVDMLSSRPEEQQKLAKVHDELKDVVYAVRRVNNQNRELLQNAMEMVEFDLNILQAMKTAPQTANYDRGAYNTGSQIGVTKSGFDAKQ